MDISTLLDKAKVKASELNPYLSDKCIELVKLAYFYGYEILITQGYRSIIEQNALYEQGRTTPGSIVTNAKGGQSNHNYRLAFDIVLLNNLGNLDWNNTDKYIAVGKLGQSIGLDWGGAWLSFIDLPHFEYTYGFSISQLQNGAIIPAYPQIYIKIEEDESNMVIQAPDWVWYQMYNIIGDGYNRGLVEWSWCQKVVDRSIKGWEYTHILAIINARDKGLDI